jgi:GT2 family glycosyltransferase
VRRDRADSGPLRVLTVDLAAPLAAVECATNGRTYGGARLLVRLGGRPLGMVSVGFERGSLTAADLARLIWRQLAEEINAHLRSLKVPELSRLPATGIQLPPWPEKADPRPRFSVVVPTADRPDRLSACLDSILAQDYPHQEILVVDNSPRSPATAVLLSHRYRNAHRLRRLVEQRPGATIARSRGLGAAREEIVVFVDDDVELDPGCLNAIAEAFSSTSDVGAVTALIVPRELDTPAQRWLEQYGGFGKGYRRQVFDLDQHRPPDRLYPYSPGIYGSGACMAFRTRLLRELGGFDTRLSVGGEDLDAFLKVILAGHRLVYDPAAVAWHLHPAEYRALQRTVMRYGMALSALMTKWVMGDPAIARAIISRLPAAMSLALGPHSRKNAGKLADYPRLLTTVERAGMAAGPFVYAQSCWKARRGDGG